MADFYTDENFPLPVVELLRSLGHDVLTAKAAGNANLSIPDEEVLAGRRQPESRCFDTKSPPFYSTASIRS